MAAADPIPADRVIDDEPVGYQRRYVVEHSDEWLRALMANGDAVDWQDLRAAHTQTITGAL